MNFYDYQRPLGKILDAPDLRADFIVVFDGKSKEELTLFGLHYAQHLLEITGYEPAIEMLQAFAALKRWLNKECNYHEARNIAFTHLYAMARLEKDELCLRFYQCMAQIACIPHVRFHALWASDFAIKLINALHPGNMEAVRKERERQIQMLKDAVIRKL